MDSCSCFPEPCAACASTVKHNSHILGLSFSTSKFSIQSSFDLSNSQVQCSIVLRSRDLVSSAFVALIQISYKLGEDFFDPAVDIAKLQLLGFLLFGDEMFA